MRYVQDNVSIYFLFTLWKRIESFNEYYLIFKWMLLLLLSEVNNTTIFLMVLPNAIDRKDRWSVYTVTLLLLLLAIDKRPAWIVYGLEPLTWFWVTVLQYRHRSGGRQNHWMVLSQCWPVSDWLQRLLLLANNSMLSSFCVTNNSFNKLINQLQFNLFVVCGRHS